MEPVPGDSSGTSGCRCSRCRFPVRRPGGAARLGRLRCRRGRAPRGPEPAARSPPAVAVLPWTFRSVQAPRPSSPDDRPVPLRRQRRRQPYPTQPRRGLHWLRSAARSRRFGKQRTPLHPPPRCRPARGSYIRRLPSRQTRFPIWEASGRCPSGRLPAEALRFRP